MNKSEFEQDLKFKTECLPNGNKLYSFFLHHFWFWIDMFVYFLVPFVTMTMSFVFIFIKINKLNNRYRDFLDNSRYRSNSQIYTKRIKKNRQVILVLFILNSYFFISSMPYYIFHILIGQVYTETNVFLKTLLNILFYSNNALNFFFYGISSQKYRQEFVAFLKSF